ncbi:1-phosphatidylinositol 4,5-bisphosphate phosphodiesterase delta-4-like isoform X2 [Centruroides vittatus]|uniref:1-phosphatidylinositol 4,5-bisphosphate phosphodiesterase delta-4-like isoform X2 n=1 Tax=Centruroides vittatus TaxID=120091 RepID=UPI00350F3A69
MEQTKDVDVSSHVEVALKSLSKGCYLYKVRSAKHFYRRRYYLDFQNLCLKYQSKRRKFCNRPPLFVDLYTIEEIRTGWNTDIFNQVQAMVRRNRKVPIFVDEDRCFSLVINSTHETLDLVAPNKEIKELWIEGLKHILAICQNLHRVEEYDRWLKDQFRRADRNNNGSLNFKECLILLGQMNISMEKNHVKSLFDEANFRKIKINGEDALDPEEFVKFFHSLQSRPDAEALFKQYTANNSTIMGPEELRNFIHKEQKMTKVSLEDCKSIIERYEPDKSKLEGYLSVKGFIQMLLSKEHSIFSPEHNFVCQDMSRPLSHYYIASSHNTYLIADQLLGESSVEGYIRALEQGCRCVELDCWDGPDDEPIVYHGYTLTTRILFRDVLDAIRQSAFKASQYPVILSLENHCSVQQQKKMAEHLVNILGDYLYSAPVKPEEQELPSPESLARKILIKNKKLDGDGTSAKPVDSDSDEDLPPTDKPRQEKPKGDSRLAAELSDLVNYVKATSFKGFEKTKTWKFYEMSSFQEVKAERLVNENGEDYVKYNRHHLSRIYPKGTRTDSSNYDPVQFWNVGCQIVALNYQTYDEPMFFNQALFLQNGGCGYVLKPEFLCKDIEYNPSDPPKEKYKEILTIKVISGQHIPKPDEDYEGEVIDPYVTVEIKGHPCDESKQSTNYVRNNGFNPRWNETFTFQICLPALAIIVFKVKDECKTGVNMTLGEYAIPYTVMAEGYRHIHLLNDFRQPIIPATIFVHVAKQTLSTKL